MDVLGYFFTEVWMHRRNRFIAVGGAAVSLLVLALALRPVPWIPESLKQTVFILCGVTIVATVLLMVYYVLKFFVVGVVLLLRRASGALRRQDPNSLGQAKLPK